MATRKEPAHRANPKATVTESELVRVARAIGQGILWTAGTIATLIGDSLSRDRKGRQRRRKENAKNNSEENEKENETENGTESGVVNDQQPDEKPNETPSENAGS